MRAKNRIPLEHGILPRRREAWFTAIVEEQSEPRGSGIAEALLASSARTDGQEQKENWRTTGSAIVQARRQTVDGQWHSMMLHLHHGNLGAGSQPRPHANAWYIDLEVAETQAMRSHQLTLEDAQDWFVSVVADAASEAEFARITVLEFHSLFTVPRSDWPWFAVATLYGTSEPPYPLHDPEVVGRVVVHRNSRRDPAILSTEETDLPIRPKNWFRAAAGRNAIGDWSIKQCPDAIIVLGIDADVRYPRLEQKPGTVKDGSILERFLAGEWGYPGSLTLGQCRAYLAHAVNGQYDSGDPPYPFLTEPLAEFDGLSAVLDRSLQACFIGQEIATITYRESIQQVDLEVAASAVGDVKRRLKDQLGIDVQPTLHLVVTGRQT